MVWDGTPLPKADQLYRAHRKSNIIQWGILPIEDAPAMKIVPVHVKEFIQRFVELHSLICSWNMYFNQITCSLATNVAPIYKQYAPVAYQNQVEYENVAQECQLGQKKGKKAKKGQKRLSLLWITTCLNFCAHPHRDIHNMNDGSKVVCILTQRDKGSFGVIPQDEQLHVLPLYKLRDTDEFSYKKGMEDKIKSGAIKVLAPHHKKQK
ncbi:Methylcytosine dioxygenase TET1 [Plecturocebus cupreus]